MQNQSERYVTLHIHRVDHQDTWYYEGYAVLHEKNGTEISRIGGMSHNILDTSRKKALDTARELARTSYSKVRVA